ncbi:hypothetical protein [Breoghania sp.]|uniref:hypothetical protein n=1 Tax=Breoghania sp. TaxID=2065378 RepID=UPI00260728F7|nr:hypothetical protein [Breoghania sp.]MDJ0929779.1 hypothetical protein [Breoghania sp.]
MANARRSKPARTLSIRHRCANTSRDTASPLRKAIQFSEIVELGERHEGDDRRCLLARVFKKRGDGWDENGGDDQHDPDGGGKQDGGVEEPRPNACAGFLFAFQMGGECAGAFSHQNKASVGGQCEAGDALQRFGEIGAVQDGVMHLCQCGARRCALLAVAGDRDRIAVKLAIMRVKRTSSFGSRTRAVSRAAVSGDEPSAISTDTSPRSRSAAKAPISVSASSSPETSEPVEK